MEKLVKVPFDLETAKKITSGEIEGRIITRNRDQARIICWGRKAPDFPIVALISGDGEEESCEYYRDNGKWDRHGDHDLDLMLEIPEYLTFKDGDVIVGGRDVLLFSGDVDEYNLCGCYCSLCLPSNRLELKFDYNGVYSETRLATEEEKQKLINALKASEEPKAKEYLKRFFGIEENTEQSEKPEHEFKPFDKVLVRENDNDFWRADFFSNMEDDIYCCIGDFWKQCIPYEGYEHLLGMTDKPE